MDGDDVDERGPIAALSLPAEAAAPATGRSITLEALFAAHRLPVYRYLRSRTSSDDEAADLTATTFEHALVAIDRLRADGRELGWLLRIARNAAIDSARRRRPAARLEELREPDQPASTETPEGVYLEIERREELRRLVRALPEPQRDAVALRYGAGLTAREIGRVIGKSEAASQKLIQRALETLREAGHVDD